MKDNQLPETGISFSCSVWLLSFCPALSSLPSLQVARPSGQGFDITFLLRRHFRTTKELWNFYRFSFLRFLSCFIMVTGNSSKCCLMKSHSKFAFLGLHLISLPCMTARSCYILWWCYNVQYLLMFRSLYALYVYLEPTRIWLCAASTVAPIVKWETAL